uniref:Uncharacterized protein n=1 Tax=Candidatus Kentrum sp. TC TaxID=2126339 RepID=A0A450ZC81_9GAMM|nr:MAG: hypothetical protein BECKTC1821F_GA0114240_100184 [Candidatus Kentron sp. TC]
MDNLVDAKNTKRGGGSILPVEGGVQERRISGVVGMEIRHGVFHLRYTPVSRDDSSFGPIHIDSAYGHCTSR